MRFHKILNEPDYQTFEAEIDVEIVGLIHNYQSKDRYFLGNRNGIVFLKLREDGEVFWILQK